MLAFEYDKFNGVVITTSQLPTDTHEFAAQLDAVLKHVKTHNKAVIWLTLPIPLAQHIATATHLGFTFHNCLPEEVTLIYKSKPTDFAPFTPTHSLGAGGLAKNSLGEILVIKERGSTTYKLPGGHIELGERIEDAVNREVLEETGIVTSFAGIVGIASTHPYRFGKSNLYIVCNLQPHSTTIDIQDTHEIEDAKWILPEQFMQEKHNSPFNKYLVKSLHQSSGLTKSLLDLSQVSKLQHEVFLANSY